jgi:hypothetical protein
MERPSRSSRIPQLKTQASPLCSTLHKSAISFANDGITSRITAVGASQTMPTGALIKDITTDQLTGTGLNLTWTFAKGVGFASVSENGGTITLSSFTVNTATSYSTFKRSARAVRGRIDSAILARFVLTRETKEEPPLRVQRELFLFATGALYRVP